MASISRLFPIPAWCAFLLLTPAPGVAMESLTDLVRHQVDGRSIILTTGTGERIRVTPYGDDILRIQAVRRGEDFYPDDRYEMVESHAWGGALHLDERGGVLRASTPGGVVVHITRSPVRLSFSREGAKDPFLSDSTGIWWGENSVHTRFRSDPREHFTGLGHGFFGRAGSIDLRGEVIERNYGTSHGQQAPLLVPFYLSSKGYGIFLNSTFPNSFSFGKEGLYEFSITGGGRMDYFVILGPEFPRILDLYTQLTGRPRFPPMAMFGLALSDKGHDHTTSTPSDEAWWKRKVLEHRNAGFPIDHLINDNRWRAGGGMRCESYFEWDAARFPDPAEYQRWLKANGLVVTIDFNRCIAKRCEGWKSSFNIPHADSVDYGESAPDFTRKEVREWFWHLFWKKSLDPALGYPGDALWIDEFDEMGKIPLATVLGNGRTWMEMKNYWFFLIAKALVQEGWDLSTRGSGRPFVWVRGMTAGAQRYATLWSGDIRPEYAEMKTQVRSMQLSGLSGFPYWGHDAGGFYDGDAKKGPDDTMYRQWSMAFGSFTPFWKPHGMGESRWPLDRGTEARKDARTYADLRYRLMPYTYTYAHEAHENGTPMARAMIIEYQNDSLAWAHDLQYMWGKEMLVVPPCADSGDVEVWLPEGSWYDFWDDTRYPGGRVVGYPSPTGKLPLFVRGGSIIPMATGGLSTPFLHQDTLVIGVYTGDDGEFTLYQDDGVTGGDRQKGATTTISFSASPLRLHIGAAVGTYEHAPAHRAYRVDLHGLTRARGMTIGGKKLELIPPEAGAHVPEDGVVWDEAKRILSVYISSRPVTADIDLTEEVK